MKFLINPVQRKNADCYYMLLEVVGMWKLSTEANTIEEEKVKKEKKEGEGKIKIKLREANQQWCDWKFQIH